MPKKIAINSYTTGKYQKRKVNGRDHLVTQMRPIRGDTAMNELYYPNSEVQKSFTQLNNLLTPSKHPKVNGVAVSAYHPLAINSQNIGGFIQNPKMRGKDVFVDFYLDLQVANESEDGKELIRRIQENEKVPVSTGLTISHIENKVGKDDFGKGYEAVGRGFQFDHVAILLNETAAGDHAGTELILNSELGEEITVLHLESLLMKVNELSVNDLRTNIYSALPTDAYIEELYTDSRTVIYVTQGKTYQQTYAVDANDVVTLLNDQVEVKKVVEYEPITNNQEVNDMNKTLFVLALITNSLIQAEDKDKFLAMSENELLDFAFKKPTVEMARSIMTANGYDVDAYIANKSQFEQFQANEKARVEAIKTEIITNSKWTAELLKDKPEAELELIRETIAGKPTPRLLPGAPVTNTQASECDYSFSGN